jgi:hypothetical protein
VVKIHTVVWVRTLYSLVQYMVMNVLSVLTGCIKIETVWSSRKAHYPTVKLHGPITWKSKILKFPVKGGGGEETVWYVKIKILQSPIL